MRERYFQNKNCSCARDTQKATFIGGQFLSVTPPLISVAQMQCRMIFLFENETRTKSKATSTHFHQSGSSGWEERVYIHLLYIPRGTQSQSEAKPDLGLKARYPKKGASPQPEPAHLKLRRFHPCAAGISPCHRQHSFKTPSPSSCPGSLLPALGQKPLPH